MDRKDFIKRCGAGCLGMIGLSLMMESCATMTPINIDGNNNVITVPRSAFIEMKKEQAKMRRYILVKAKEFDFPIIVYRINELEFSALLLRCTHQGYELNVNGDILTCPAHGSEFDKSGTVLQGPAENPLHSFKVTGDTVNLFIHLI